MKPFPAIVGAFVLSVALTARPAAAESRTVFSGLPSVKISEGGVERVADDLPREKAVNLGCIISEIDGKYYWATRENREMLRIASGAYITYVAINGAGYVRVLDPKFKSAAGLVSETEVRFDYVEHILQGLVSVTYYGSLKSIAEP